MNKNLFEHRMLKIREEELKVVKEDNYKLLKELIRQQETNRQFLLYIQKIPRLMRTKYST